MQYWLSVTSPENFQLDRDVLGFKLEGHSHRYRKQVQRMNIGDRLVYYITKLQKFGATATVTGDYFEETTKIWPDDLEIWPARRPIKSDFVLNDDELIDAKRLVPNLSFVKKEDVNWGVYFRAGIRDNPRRRFQTYRVRDEKSYCAEIK